MLTAGEFGQLLAIVGEPVTFHQAKAPQAVQAIRAIVQSNAKAPDSVINSFGVNGRTVQMAAAGFAVPPEKFDWVTLANGERWVFEMVDPQHERGSGAITYWIGYCKGK